MEENVRTADGRFRKGAQSPNPAGRRGRQRYVTPSDFRKAILAVSRRKVQIARAGGGVRDVTLLAFHIRNLGAANPGTSLASRDFISLVRHAAAVEEALPVSHSHSAYHLPTQGSGAGRPATVRDTATGQFVAGASGNPRGRPRRKVPSLRLQHNLEIIADANRRTRIRENGREETMTTFEAQLLKLGVASGGVRIAIRKYIELVLEASHMVQFLQQKEAHEEAVRAKAEAAVYWRTMTNGTEEEKQAMLAASPEMPPVETMPYDVLAQCLGNLDALGDDNPAASVRQPAGSPDPGCEFEYISKEMWDAMVKEAGSVEELIRQAAESEEKDA